MPALSLKRELQRSAGWTLVVSDHGDSKASACAGKRAPASPAAEDTVLAQGHSVHAGKAKGDTALLSSGRVHTQHTVDSGGNGFCLLTTSF